MNTNLKPAPASSNSFMWNGTHGVAEMSELRGGLGRVWADSCDEGLTVVSAKTGTEKVFVVDHVEYREGDLLWWDLKSVTGTRIDGQVTLTLFND